MLIALAGRWLQPTRRQQRQVLLARGSLQGLWAIVAFIINPLLGFLFGAASFLINFRSYRVLTPTGPYCQKPADAALTARVHEIYHAKRSRA